MNKNDKALIAGALTVGAFFIFLYFNSPPWPSSGQEWERRSDVPDPPCVGCAEAGITVHPPRLVIDKVEGSNVLYTGLGERARSHGSMPRRELWHYFRIVVRVK